MSGIPEALAAAFEHHRAGQLREAEHLCRQVLAADPRQARAWNLLGVIAMQVGHAPGALDALGRAVALEPGVAKYHNDLAAACLNVRRLDEAEASCRRSLQLDPNDPAGHFNLALILRDEGRWEEAVAACQRALALRPDYVEAHNNLGILLQDRGRLDEAIACYQRALAIRPAYLKAHNNLGSALTEQGRFREAVAACERALQIDPHYAEAHFNQGNAFAAARRPAEAAACYRQALALRPDHVGALNKLGAALRSMGQFDEAVAAHRQAAQVNPGNVEAHHSLAILHEERGEIDEAAASYRRIRQIAPHEPLWELRLATLCPDVFPSADEIDEFRARLLGDLKRFAEMDLRVDLSKLPILGTGPPYDLQFHGRDDRPIKEAYAEIFRNWDPGEAAPARGPRHRIGFVVTDPHEAMFLKCMQGIVENLDKARFEPVVICSPGGAPMVRARIQDEGVGVLPIPDRVGPACEVIRAGRFDLLYYWEVGSGTANYFLPFFRLAPVQCTGWGLPVTSGIPQMDYYLTNDLVEPEGAERHYRERLVRANTLLTWQERPLLPEAPKTRADFGLPEDAHVYGCLQQLHKLHPEFDLLVADVLRRDASGIVVVPEDTHEANTRKLRDRFARVMPDVADRIVFVRRQAYPDYLGLVATADVLLDPLHFGGGLTTYEGFALGQPIVTLPGEFRRGRLTLACYAKMGITECVAADAEDYARIAVALAEDRDYRASVVEDIREASPVLFEDMGAVREYERIFEELIEGAG
jgi:protein O-GlcNAc transferase